MKNSKLLSNKVFWADLNTLSLKRVAGKVFGDNPSKIVLLNLSSGKYTLDDLLQLNTYNYFWQRDGREVYVGKHINGRPVVGAKLTDKVFKALAKLNLKTMVLGENNPKKVLNLSKYRMKKDLPLDQEGKPVGRSLESVLAAIVNWFEFKLDTTTLPKTGMDGHPMRDAMGFVQEYTTSAYDTINVLVRSEGIDSSILWNYRSKMVFYKVIDGELTLVKFGRNWDAYWTNYERYLRNTYSDRVKLIESSKAYKVKSYARLFGMNPHNYDYDGISKMDNALFDLDIEIQLVLQNYVRTGYLDNIASEVSTSHLLDVADTFNDKILKKYVEEQIEQGNLPEEDEYFVGNDDIFSALAHGFATTADMDKDTDGQYTDYDHTDYDAEIAKHKGEVKSYFVSKEELAELKKQWKLKTVK